MNNDIILDFTHAQKSHSKNSTSTSLQYPMFKYNTCIKFSNLTEEAALFDEDVIQGYTTAVSWLSLGCYTQSVITWW